MPIENFSSVFSSPNNILSNFPSAFKRNNCSVADNLSGRNSDLSSFGKDVTFTSVGVLKNGFHGPWIDGQAVRISLTNFLIGSPDLFVWKSHYAPFLYL